MRDIDVSLTGNMRYRQSWLGKMILQVEETGRSECPHGGYPSPFYTRWRDANCTDLLLIKYRGKLNFPFIYGDVDESL